MRDDQDLAFMPTKKSVEKAGLKVPESWVLTTCPNCGQECYRQPSTERDLLRVYPGIKFICTECGLKARAGGPFE